MGAKPSVETLPVEEAVWAALRQVADPEIPVLSVTDLGIVRDVRADASGVEVDVAPTYNGCPATEVIETLVARAARRASGAPVKINRVLSPPWTTDWISEAGRRKLSAYGIAPPAGATKLHSITGEDRPAACPRCGSVETTRVSEFGSTPCKAAYTCDTCLEPFEYFKCL